jgi:NAD(P)H-dependent flavin oxidoreductase YrpB (nitropropane dioxygenase family)
VTHPALQTPICELLGIRLPIVQTGMGWVSGARLTAATSAAGGLGILGSATMSLVELEQAVREVKAATDRPFGVNLRADQDDVEGRIDLIVREKVKVASFAQAPRRELVEHLAHAGVITMATVGARGHAEKVAAWGIDVILAQGHEGGGHTGAVPTSILLPQVVDAVKVPVLGAGGFCDGRGLVAALAWGAAGIAMGTRFLLTRESTVPDEVKRVYLATQADGTVVTRAIDGYPQRVIRTSWVDKLERSGRVMGLLRALGYAWRFRKLTGAAFLGLVREGLAMRRSQGLTFRQVAMAASAPMMTRRSMVEGRLDDGILPTGQNVGRIAELPTVAELLDRIEREAEEALGRLAGAAHPRAAQGEPYVASR